MLNAQTAPRFGRPLLPDRTRPLPKLCNKCGRNLGAADFYWSKSKRLTPCKTCTRTRVRARYTALPEERKQARHAATKQWISRNRQHYNAKTAERFQRLRIETLLAYGGRCACCGLDDIRFLTIDHINGRLPDQPSRSYRWTGKFMYAWLKRNNFPTGYQALCWNCNSAKGIHGVCPHMEVKPC